MKSCPNCQAQIPDENKFCSKCGYKIPEPTKPKFIYFKGLNNTYLFHCTKCDSEFTSEDGKFCPGCGNKLPDSIDDETLMNCMDITDTVYIELGDRYYIKNKNMEIPFVEKVTGNQLGFARVTGLIPIDQSFNASTKDRRIRFKDIHIDRIKVPPTLQMGYEFEYALFAPRDQAHLCVKFIDVFKGGKVDYYHHGYHGYDEVKKCPQESISDLFDCWERDGWLKG